MYSHKILSRDPTAKRHFCKLYYQKKKKKKKEKMKNLIAKMKEKNIAVNLSKDKKSQIEAKSS